MPGKKSRSFNTSELAADNLCNTNWYHNSLILALGIAKCETTRIYLIIGRHRVNKKYCLLDLQGRNGRGGVIGQLGHVDKEFYFVPAIMDSSDWIFGIKSENAEIIPPPPAQNKNLSF